MVSRRDFMKAAALGAAGFAAPVKAIPSRRQTKGYFSVHPFIENHPEAVFIMKTNVDHKMNAEAKLREGLAFSRSVFVPMNESGVPVNISIPVKPNLVSSDPEKYPVEDLIGIVTDPFFVEGVLEGIKELGIAGSQFHLREVNRPKDFSDKKFGYADMVERIGADLRLDLYQQINQLTTGKDYNWKEVSDGQVFKQIPHLEPINTSGTWLLNIAKFKAHSMGVTGCCKNLQGLAARTYQRFCWPFVFPGVFDGNQHENAKEMVTASYKRHCKDGVIPRWDKKGIMFNLEDYFPNGKGPAEYGGGMMQETWANRTLDNVSVTPCGIHIIEGIYGRDGSSHMEGPHPLDQEHKLGPIGLPKGKSKDYMSNVIMFGMDPFRVDIIEHWLAGHEPGNFGYLHIALERGMSKVLDPSKIPIYLWNDETATLTHIEELERTPLLTSYLRKDYNGGNESPYHMVDEPFDYSLVDGVEKLSRPVKPGVSILYQQLISPENAKASIEYCLPMSGFTKLEILDNTGRTVAVPTEGFRFAGVHMAKWDTSNHSAGKYSYKLRINGYKTKGELALLK